MIVGAKNIPTADLITNIDRLPSYCEELIPPPLRGNVNVLNNQKYYVSLLVQKIHKLSFQKRAETISDLLTGVYVKGTLTDVIDFRDLLGACNEQYLKARLEEEGFA